MTASGRDQWIIARRSRRKAVDPHRPIATLLEEERAESGELVSVATIFLTNRECPWHCLMCDLWKNTLTETVPPGAIPAQIDFALAQLGGRARQDAVDSSTPNSRELARDIGRGPTSAATSIRQIKLYNSGSFFDPRAIPLDDYQPIVRRVAAFELVIVECHPALIGRPVLRFRDLLAAANASSRREHAPGAGEKRTGPPPLESHHTKLEVAMGLETAHPQVLEKLNKRMTLDQFRRAATFLRQNDIALRVFVLVKPPFLDEAEGLDWAGRSVDFAFDCGARAVSLIPTRPGNGAMEALAERGEFSPLRLPWITASD